MPAPPKTTQSGKTLSGKTVTSKLATGSKPRAARTCVLHLCSDLEPGDPARETVDLAVLTQRGGWRALIASNGGLLVLEAERAAVRHTRMPLGKRGVLVGWRNRAHIEALIQRERPSLIHAHGIEALSHVIGLCRLHHLPLVVDLTQPVTDDARTQRLLKQLEDMQALLRVPSDYMAMHLREVFHLAPEHIATIPPGIDMRWHDAGGVSPERLQSLSRLWRLPEQATVLLVPMPLAAGSGHQQFLAALAKLKRNDVFTVLVGDERHAPGMRAEVEQLVSRCRLDGKVIMPEYCLDWPAACWLAGIVVAPNVAPRGQVTELLAAQAIGRPVIVTDCGANPEMVLNGETAWVVPPDDIPALAEALREAIELHTAQRVDLAERTRNFIADAFPQEAWFNAMMDVYEALLHPSVRTRSKAA